MPFLNDLIKQVYEELAQRMALTEQPGLTTGIPAVDEMVGGGWVRQQLSYLVGDSGIGKSWLASNWMLQGIQYLVSHPGWRPNSGYVVTGAAEKDKVRLAVKNKENKTPVVVFWSLEMSESALITRLISQVAVEVGGTIIDSGKLMRGSLGVPEGTDAYDKAMTQMRDVYWTIHNELGKHVFMEFEAQSISQFREILDELTLAYDVCMIVVDYFRLIDEVSTDGNMTTIQAERSKKLKSIAKEYDCHVLSIFDINREGQRAGTPQNYHMRGGVAAHYDADLILTIALADDGEGSAKAKAKDAGPEKHIKLQVTKGRYVANSGIDLLLNTATGAVTEWSQQEGSIHGYRKGE